MVHRLRFGFTLFVLLAALGLLSGFAQPMVSPTVLNVPLTRQSTSYSCGPAALLGLLAYYGIEDLNESELMKETAADPAKGTNIENLAAYAVKKGLKAEVKTGLKLQDLVDSLKHNQPVIVDAQAWPDHDKPAPHYPDVWDSGHFMVVIAIDHQNVYFMDPSLLGSRGYIPIPEFMDRWHELSAKGEKWYHTAILFEGTPKPPPAWYRVP